MIKIINNIWSIIKLSILLLVLVMVMTFVDTDKLITSGMMLLGFYIGFKGVNLLYLLVKRKIEGVEDTETVVKEEDKINPEIVYIEGLRVNGFIKIEGLYCVVYSALFIVHG